MSPIPKMVIATALARRKGELEVGSLEEIDELISQLIIAKTGILGAQSAIGAQGAMEAVRDVEAQRAGREPDPAATPAADGEHVTCPACGFRDGRHNPAGCRRLERLERIGKRVTALSEPGDPSGPPPEVLAKMAARGMAEPAAPRTAEMVPLDESLPWATVPAGACGWSGPDGEHCLLKPHGPNVAHAAPIGAGSMRRWAPLRSVTG